MNQCQHIDGCPRPVKAYGWCRAHWDRIKKTGDPGPVHVAERLPSNRPCKVDDCDKQVALAGAHGLCTMHYQRLRTHGDVAVVARGGASLALDQNPNWSGDDASYAAVHLRLRRMRGSARNQSCADCGDRAAHWSYDNSGVAERIAPRGWRYSTDLTRYEPRCVPCHRRHDNAARLALLTGERP